MEDFWVGDDNDYQVNEMNVGFLFCNSERMYVCVWKFFGLEMIMIINEIKSMK